MTCAGTGWLCRLVTHATPTTSWVLCAGTFTPDIVTHKGNTEPAKSWDHYKDAPDACGDKQERVRREFWVSLARTTLINTSHSFDFF